VSSLDELPQLVNVLRGDMSLVGPRPITAEELPRYGVSATAYLSMRPGLTGPWQVSGRNAVSYEERVKFDRDYAADAALLRDLSIILFTVVAVFRRTGR
jgi:exopolysaccharide production protein ExoY